MMTSIDIDTTDVTRWTTDPSTTFFRSREVPTPGDVDVLVLGGGRGSRLRSSGLAGLTEKTKMLVEVDAPDGERAPMIAHTVRGLLGVGFSRISILTSDDVDAQGVAVEAELLRRFIGPVGLRFLRESAPLGTAGAVYAALAHVVGDLVIACPGDTLFPYPALVDGLLEHGGRSAALTWFVTSQPDPLAQNANRLIVDRHRHRLVVAAEGHHDALGPVAADHAPATSVGAVLIDTRWYRRIFADFVEVNDVRGPVDLYRDLLPWSLGRGEPLHVYDIGAAAPDLGTPDRLFEYGRRTPGGGPAAVTDTPPSGHDAARRREGDPRDVDL